MSYSYFCSEVLSGDSDFDDGDESILFSETSVTSSTCESFDRTSVSSEKMYISMT